MTKPFSLCAVAAALLVAGSLSAQRPALGMPARPQPHPAFASQPLVENALVAPVTPRQRAGGGGQPAKKRPQPATRGVKVSGKALKRAVGKVAALPWNDSLKTARKQAAKLDRPILLLQTLGDIDGFA